MAAARAAALAALRFEADTIEVLDAATVAAAADEKARPPGSVGSRGRGSLPSKPGQVAAMSGGEARNGCATARKACCCCCCCCCCCSCCLRGWLCCLPFFWVPRLCGSRVGRPAACLRGRGGADRCLLLDLPSRDGAEPLLVGVLPELLWLLAISQPSEPAIIPLPGVSQITQYELSSTSATSSALFQMNPPLPSCTTPRTMSQYRSLPWWCAPAPFNWHSRRPFSLRSRKWWSNEFDRSFFRFGATKRQHSAQYLCVAPRLEPLRKIWKGRLSMSSESSGWESFVLGRAPLDPACCKATAAAPRPV
mmetsp:Transcript_4340/g.12933  ORF Transcript_4340/g.12933 Transcript_4340/m.12933 type:complete len:307 (+) Transcript_4340:1310-2230(+)